MKEKKQTKDKLTMKRTLANDWYALKLGLTYSKPLVIHSFIMVTLGYFEWVFFDAIFMREIVNGLDQNVGFTRIFTFILIC